MYITWPLHMGPHDPLHFQNQFVSTGLDWDSTTVSRADGEYSTYKLYQPIESAYLPFNSLWIQILAGPKAFGIYFSPCLALSNTGRTDHKAEKPSGQNCRKGSL